VPNITTADARNAVAQIALDHVGGIDTVVIDGGTVLAA
jgi:hypothetical protein